MTLPKDSASVYQPNETQGPRNKYMSRRATHSSRAVTAVVVSLLALAATVYLLVELILSMSNRDPLLATPGQMLQDLPIVGERVIFPWLAVGGIVAALIGLIILIKSFAPGTLGRHRVRTPRTAFIVDDSVLAAGVSAAVRQAGNLAPGQVTTSVDKSRVDVTVVPHAGRSVDEDVLRQAMDATVRDLDLYPNVRTRLRILDGGDS